jgi:hypothetical protein
VHKRDLIILLAICVVLVFMAWQACLFETIYALCMSDVEIVLRVVDEETGNPVSGATVLLRDYNDSVEPTIEKAVTDQDGRAVFFRKDLMSEDIIRPFRPTQRTFNLGWGAYDVSSDGYAPIENQPLVEFENQGRIGGKGAFRLQFTVALRK